MWGLFDESDIYTEPPHQQQMPQFTPEQLE